jgi:hypothetical protein
MYCPCKAKTITGICHCEPQRGEAITLLDRYRMRIISALLVFVFIFSGGFIKDAYAGRSNAGGGDKARFDFGDVALNVGISIGTAIAGQALSSAWQAASPVTASDMVFLEDMGYGMSKMDQILYTANNLFTSTEPWVKGFSSLTSLSTVGANMISGFNTYAAISQAGRAAAMAGNYYEWDDGAKFLVSSLAVGVTSGFLNPEIALGIKDVAPLSGYDMAKGALVGGVGSGAKAVIIYTIDKDEFSKPGYSPSPAAQIAGLVGGVAATNFGRAAMDPDTYRPRNIKSEERAKPLPNPREFAHDGDIRGAADPAEMAGAIINERSPSIYAYVNIDKVAMDGTVTLGERLQTDKFERGNLNSSIKRNPIVPGVAEYIDRGAYVGADEALYRIFVKAPIIDTFSRASWPGLAAEAAGILVRDSLKDAQWAERWVAPLLTEFTRAASQTIFSSVANIGGVGLDMYFGSQYDLNKARLQYVYFVINKGKEHYMDEQIPQFTNEEVKRIMDKTKEFNELKAQLREYPDPLPDEYLEKLAKLEKERRINSITGRPYSITGEPYAILPNLNNRSGVIEQLNAQGEYFPFEERQQVERDVTNLFNTLDTKDTDKALVDLNRNLIITQENMRVGKMMGFDEYGNRISLPDALGVLGKKGGVETSRLGLIFEQIIFGLRSDAFQSLTKVAASVMVKDMAEPKPDSLLTNIFQPYLANMAAAAIRGIAWHYGWDYASRNWQWHTEDAKTSRFDYPEPEKYDKVFGQPGFDFIRYKSDQANYGDDMARWNRFNEFNNFNKADRVGLIYHKERQKYEFGKGNVPDPRWVSHKIFTEEKPSLAYAIGESIKQADMDYLSGAFSFGRPFVRSSIDDASIGIEPAQVSSASFMSYISNLQNISGKGISDAIRSNALDPDTGAIVNSLSKIIGGTLLQIPKVPELFHMQPERLVLTSTLREEEQPLVKVTTENKYFVAEDSYSIFGPIGKERDPSKPIKATERKTTEDGPGVNAGYGKGAFRQTDPSLTTQSSLLYYLGQEKYTEGTLKIKELIKHGELETVVPPYRNRREEFIPYPPANVIPMSNPQEGGPPPLPYGLFLSNSVIIMQWSQRIDVQKGIQTYYIPTGLKAMPSTIQSLRYGGGGMPHANYVFLDPFPNPFYQPRPQTGPITYLKTPAQSIQAILPSVGVAGDPQSQPYNTPKYWEEYFRNQENRKEGNFL